jgi:Omp85 superfamily domain
VRSPVIWFAALAVSLLAAAGPSHAQSDNGGGPDTDPGTRGEPAGPDAPDTDPDVPADPDVPNAAERPGPPVTPPLTARDVADAPRPDAARNLVRDDRSAARHLLWAPRALLFVPKWGLWLAASPVRGGLYAYEAYGLNERIRRLFSGEGFFSIYPSLARESGHGLTYGVGAGLSHYVRGNFLFGGEVRRIYELRLKTDELLGEDFELELAGHVHQLDESLFFGIGNNDLVSSEMESGIDARADDTAVSTRFDQEILRGELFGRWQPWSWLTARATAAYIRKDYDPIGEAGADRVPVGEVYDTDSLVGFAGGARFGYGELRAIYDDRESTNPFVSLAQPATGWKLEGFAGYAHGFEDDPSRYLRYGLDVQRFFDLYHGDRVLLLRAYVEGVTADIDEIPFTELPRVGGSRLVRGYARNRFRDLRATGFTAEYKYPISRTISAFVFLDGGGAWRKFTDFDPTELHPGYGGGIQLHTAQLFLTRFLVGAGDDGVTFYLSFSPSSQLQLTTHQW